VFRYAHNTVYTQIVNRLDGNNFVMVAVGFLYGLAFGIVLIAALAIWALGNRKV
jgi:hypothetical protein